MNKKDFENLMAGLDDALSFAKGRPNPAARRQKVKVDRIFVAATRLKAGSTQEEFTKVTGASLGAVRKGARRAGAFGRRENVGSNSRA